MTTVLPKLIYHVITKYHKVPFLGNWGTDAKIHVEMQSILNANILLKKENQVLKQTTWFQDLLKSYINEDNLVLMLG